jgi:hypothetical protein
MTRLQKWLSHAGCHCGLIAGLTLLSACGTTAPAAPITAAATSAPSPAAVATLPSAAVPTLAPTAQLTIAPTAIPPTSAPALQATTGAQILFQDNFSADGGVLGTYKDADGSSSYANGVYKMTVTRPTNYIHGATVHQEIGSEPKNPATTTVLEQVSIEVDAVKLSGPASGDFGIACGWQSLNAFYAFLVSADGRHYSIARVRELVPGHADFVLLAGQDRGDPQSAILTANGALNHLRVECGGKNLTLSANGHKLAEAAAPDSTAGGIALLTYTRGSGPLEVNFDNLVVRKLTADPVISATAKSGQVLFKEDFAASTGIWPTTKKSDESVEFKGGTYHVTLPLTATNRFYAPQLFALTDLSAELDITQLSGSERAYAGIVFRDRDKLGYYDVVVGTDGTYAIGKQHTGKDLVPLVDYTDNAAIRKGLNQTNHLRVDCLGDKITITINGQKITELTDPEFKAGYLDIEVGSPNSGPAEFNLDNFTVRRP